MLSCRRSFLHLLCATSPSESVGSLRSTDFVLLRFPGRLFFILFSCFIQQGKATGTPNAGSFFRIVDEYEVCGMFTTPTSMRTIRQEVRKCVPRCILDDKHFFGFSRIIMANSGHSTKLTGVKSYFRSVNETWIMSAVVFLNAELFPRMVKSDVRSFTESTFWL